jgi:hypothetical protein
MREYLINIKQKLIFVNSFNHKLCIGENRFGKTVFFDEYKMMFPTCTVTHEFKQIYSPNYNIEIKQMQTKVDKPYMFNSLIQSLKSNVEESQTENDTLKNSLEFYRNT